MLSYERAYDWYRQCFPRTVRTPNGSEADRLRDKRDRDKRDETKERRKIKDYY